MRVSKVEGGLETGSSGEAKMSETMLVLGGCRSGKSRHALALAEKRAGSRNSFIATCVARDAEMNERVRRHQSERGDRWRTVEAPLDLPGALAGEAETADVIIVDCLTLWMNNLIMEEPGDEAIFARVERLAAALEKAGCPVFLVSNEVGTGIVPENRLARRFRDLAGFANQRMAAFADRVVWMVAGIPVPVK